MKIFLVVILFLVNFNIYSQDVFFNYDVHDLEVVKLYYDNGAVKELGYLDGSVKVGTWTKWSVNGIKINKVSYDNTGKKDGTWKVWDDNGNLRAEMYYSNGLLPDRDWETKQGS